MESSKEISAEMLLNYLYPEVDRKWKVKCKGTFYRNYNQDMVSYDEETGEVILTRDGMLRLMPDAVFADVDELRTKDKEGSHAMMVKRRKLLNAAFAPFDTINFTYNLRIERQVSSLLNQKLNYILLTYFAFDLENEKDPMVREAATLLPFISSKRGDLHFVATLLRSLYDCEVEMDLSHRHSDTDSSREWMPMVRYNILLRGMDRETYLRKTEQLKPLTDFIEEWLIPFDVKCRIAFKDHIVATADKKLILDYNTEI